MDAIFVKGCVKQLQMKCYFTGPIFYKIVVFRLIRFFRILVM